MTKVIGIEYETDPLKVPAEKRNEAQKAYVEMVVRQETERLKAKYPEDVAKELALRALGQPLPPKEEATEPEEDAPQGDVLGDDWSKP